MGSMNSNSVLTRADVRSQFPFGCVFAGELLSVWDRVIDEETTETVEKLVLCLVIVGEAIGAGEGQRR